MNLIRRMTGIIFVLLVVWGLWISSSKSLWQDEYCSLIYSTYGHSYRSILTGEVNEGNNSPLFYIIQKIQCDLFFYHPPWRWFMDNDIGGKAYDRVFLRVQSVIVMAAGLSALFYYFSRRYSLMAGFYAIAVSLTSSLFWVHWTEARPYADSFSLSILQFIFLLKILEGPLEEQKKNLTCLTAVHWLLALTASVNIVQILSAGAVLWLYQVRKLSFHILLVLIPLAICFFYYAHAPHYLFYFVNGPVSLINANIPKDRLFIIFMAAVFLCVRCGVKKGLKCLEIKYLIFLLLMLASFGSVLLTLKMSEASPGHGFMISSRYFLSLTPAGIVGTVLFSLYLVGAFPSRVWKIAAVLILAGFLIFRTYKVGLWTYIKSRQESVPMNLNV